MRETPTVGEVAASVVMTVVLVTAVIATGAVPAVVDGHGVPSSQPPPGPGGEAVGAVGIESRKAMFVGTSVTVVTVVAAWSASAPWTAGITVPVIVVDAITRLLLVAVGAATAATCSVAPPCSAGYTPTMATAGDDCCVRITVDIQLPPALGGTCSTAK